MVPRSVRIAKRLLDVVGATIGLAATWPLYPALALAIRLDSPGPVFFRQRRVRALAAPGAPLPARYRTFELVKFRTMRVDAERLGGPVLAAPGDPRITRVGRFLRQSRLDELPQLVHVLRGEMSLVGPRPERPELTAELAASIPYFEERLRVKPGLTGPAQVHLGYTGAIPAWGALWGLAPTLESPAGLEEPCGGLADDMRAKLLYDLAYVAASWRLATLLPVELGVLLRTPLVMLKKLGT